MSDYRQAGVDTEKSAQFIRTIAPLIKQTARAGASAELGGFGGLFDLKAAGFSDPLLVAATDGVGTKLKLAIESAQHDSVGVDLVAMCVNDLIVQGAEPLFFLDYFAMGQLLPDDDMHAIVAGITRGCAEAGCALIGGETAEMPGMYAVGDYDLAGFTVGAVEREHVLDSMTLRGDEILLALPSSGFHSNGFSLIRKIIATMDGHAPAPFAPEQSLYQALLTPTRIYVKPILPLIKSGKIKAMWHITGGGFYENLVRGLADNIALEVTQPWAMPACFRWLAKQGDISARNMFSTFNCGVGMVLAVAESEAAHVEQQLGGFTIGRAKPRDQHALEIHPDCLASFH